MPRNHDRPTSPRNSTNGRSAVPGPLRAGMAALSAVAPALAARAGERLFMSPPRTRAPAREREELAGWQPFSVEHAGARLAAWQRGSGPSVLLVHGWGGRGGQLSAFAPALEEAGCRVVAFDAPAHGASPGRLASALVFADAVDAMARATGARAVIGHSLGGAAVAVALTRGVPFDAAVLVGAPRAPGGFFQSFGDAFALSEPMRAAVRARIEARVGMRLDELDLPAMAPRAAAAPLLVVHDHSDAEVPFASGSAIAEAWPGARLLATDGLGHRRILRDPEVIDAAVSFLVERLPRCACGRLACDETPGGEPSCAGCAVADDLWARGRRRAWAMRSTAEVTAA